MKRACGLLILVLLSLPAAQSSAASTPTSTRDPATTDLRGDPYRNGGFYFPPIADRDFDTPLRFGIGTGLDVGCAGVDLQHLLDQYFMIDYAHILDYLKANAAGMAINYVIYSNPTMYTLIQHLKQGADFAVNLNQVTCTSIRQAADTKRAAATFFADAKALCLQERSPLACQDDAVLESYGKRAVEARKQKMQAQSSDLAGKGTVTVNEFLSANMGLSNSTKALLNKWLPNTTYSSDGSVVNSSPTVSMSDELNKKTVDNVKRLNDVLDGIAKGDPNARTKLTAMNTEDGVEPITYTAATMIATRYSPDERRALVQRLAVRQSIGQVTAELHRVNQSLITGLSDEGKTALLSQDRIVALQKRQGELRGLLEDYELENRALDSQKDFLSNVIKNAPPDRPIIR